MPHLGVLAAVSLAVVGLAAAPAGAEPALGQIVAAGTAEVVPDSYLVVFKDTVAKDRSAAKTAELSARFGGRTGQVFHDALRGFEVSLPETDARRLAADPAVAFVQQNGVSRATGSGTQNPTPSWGLDRIDQTVLPLDQSYTYPSVASNVTAYVIDTGIRFSHAEFGGRAVSGFDAIDGGAADDANGHGTHVAGTIGGKNHGVAKNVKLVGVRVLDATGHGTNAQVIAGIDWVTANHQPAQAAVANMSLGGGANLAIDTAVRNSIADGIVYGVAAGNDQGANACNSSPSRVTEAITVAASTASDMRASFSNVGSCVDIFAPGQDIVSAWATGDTAIATLSGTSMATPHVVGAAAVALARVPLLTPAGVRDYLVQHAANNKIKDVGTGSPNKLLYVQSLFPAALGVSAPLQNAPKPAGAGVTVSWTDTAFNEDGFLVERANGGGQVVTVPTVDKKGSTTYAVVDAHPVPGAARCYWITAYSNAGVPAGTSEALCVGD